MKTIHKKRYFIVFYAGLILTKQGKVQMQGQSTLSTYDNRYLNRIRTIDILKKDNALSQVIITNIIELSKDDYRAWIEDIKD